MKANASYEATSPEQAMELWRMPLDRLMAQADALRKERFGNTVDLCAIINAKSGNCAMDCAFCSQSRHNTTDVQVFPLMSTEAMKERLLTLAALPVAHMGIVTSGVTLNDREFDAICTLLSELPKDLLPRVCFSLGALSRERAARLREAGILRYHHNLETSRDKYGDICTTQTWDSRRKTVEGVMGSGLQACTGGLFGMGETSEDRIAFAFSLKGLGVPNIPLNFLNAHPGTPLANRPRLAPEEALRIIAVFRHVLPSATLRICGGRQVVLEDRQEEVFAAGANALMVGDYLTTIGSAVEDDLAMLHRLGLEPGSV
jgi:biotin synthase